MSTNLQKFKFHTFTLETIDRDGEIWFIASPLASFLGYLNPSEAIRTNVDDEDIAKIYIPIKSANYTCINESGLYSLVFRSNKPEAKTFKRWVTHEVLPSIRKTGSYIDTDRKLTTLSHEEIYHNLAVKAAAMRKALPGLNITDDCNLLISGLGRTNRSDEPKERIPYYREMDKLNLPGIVVIEKKPIKIIFDWLEIHKHDPELVEALYKELGKLCAGRKSMSAYCDAKPFELSGSLEELSGFKTTVEAQNLAKAMRTLVAESVWH